MDSMGKSIVCSGLDDELILARVYYYILLILGIIITTANLIMAFGYEFYVS